MDYRFVQHTVKLVLDKKFNMKDTDQQKLYALYTESKENEKKPHDPKADLNKDGKQSEYEKKRADAIYKNDDDESNDHHICATKVEHHKFGHGTPIFSEHAAPDSEGYVSWYTVQFEHGAEVVNTADLTVHEESSHGNH